MSPPEITLRIIPEFDCLARSRTSALFVCEIAASAAASSGTRRLVVAVDRSSSMTGGPLVVAKRTVRALVDALRNDDEIALVTFDGHAEVLIPPTRLDPLNRARLGGAIDAISAGRGTALADAIHTAVRVAADAPESTVTRAVVVTDGEPSGGEHDPHRIGRGVASHAKRIAVSTIAIGEVANRAFLRTVAQAGRGRAYGVIEGGDPAPAAASELGALLATGVVQATLRIEPAPGVRLVRYHERCLSSGPDGEPELRLPPLLVGEPVRVVIELAWDGARRESPASLGDVIVEGLRAGESHPLRAVAPISVRLADAAGAQNPEAAEGICCAMAACALHDAVVDPWFSRNETFLPLANRRREFLARATEAGILEAPAIIARAALLTELQHIVGQQQHEERERFEAFLDGIARGYNPVPALVDDDEARQARGALQRALGALESPSQVQGSSHISQVFRGERRLRCEPSATPG